MAQVWHVFSRSGTLSLTLVPRLLARSSTGQGGEVAVSAASVRGAGGPCTLLVLRSRTSLPGWLPSAVGTTGPPPMAGALRSWGTLGIMSSPERHE